jgi:tripartite-type tricarboxylate transporter receptor subunit TctC
MIARGQFVPKLIFGVLTVLALTSTGTLAQDAASFYKDKVLTLVVGFGPGGGYDAYARFLAPFLEARTGATVVVKNVPGGGSLVAMNQVYKAEPDGLTLMLIAGHSATVSQMTYQEGARFDVTKFSWLARVVKETEILFVGAKSPYRSVDDLLKSDRPIKFAGGRGAGHHYFILCRALDLDCKFISGYKGIKEMALAVIRGEADAFSMFDSSAKAFAQGDKIIPIAAFGRERSPLFNDSPALLELEGLSDDQKLWLEFEDKVRTIGRALVASPGVPADRVAFLRAAIEQVLSDPQVLAAAAEIKRPLNFLAGEEEAALAQEIIGLMNSDMREEIRNVLLNKTN